MEKKDAEVQHVKVELSGNGFALSFRAVADANQTREFFKEQITPPKNFGSYEALKKFKEREKGIISLDDNLLKDGRNCMAFTFNDEDPVKINIETGGHATFKGTNEDVSTIERGRIQKYDGWDDEEKEAFESYANAEYIPADTPFEKIIKNEEEGYGVDMYGIVIDSFNVDDILLVNCADAKITATFEFDLAEGETFDISKLSLFREYDSEPSPLGEGCRFVDIIKYDNKIVFGEVNFKSKSRQGYYMFPYDSWFDCEYLCGNKKLLNFIF